MGRLLMTCICNPWYLSVIMWVTAAMTVLKMKVYQIKGYSGEDAWFLDETTGCVWCECWFCDNELTG